MRAHRAGLSIKVRGDNRRVRELIPVQPGQWDVRRVSRYELRYRCWDEFGVIGEFTPDDVSMLSTASSGMGMQSQRRVLARSAVGFAIATERSQAAMHANGLRPSGTYSVEGTLSKEQYEALTAHLKRRSGPDNTGAPMVLDRGAKWLSTSINGVDAQHVETRRADRGNVPGSACSRSWSGTRTKPRRSPAEAFFFGSRKTHTRAMAPGMDAAH